LEADAERLTTSNWVSPGFSPPEQLNDFMNVDERGDLYSLGATLYNLLTGELYSPAQGLRNVARADVKYILENLLKRDKNERFQSVTRLCECWSTLHSNLSMTEYLRLPREQRIAKLETVADVYCGMGGDLLKVLDALSYLEQVLNVEQDKEVLEIARKAHVHVDREGYQIAREMEQDNPP
jgi:serine/threonine protein kinase